MKKNNIFLAVVIILLAYFIYRVVKEENEPISIYSERDKEDSIQTSPDAINFNKSLEIDSVKIALLKQNFILKKDEFSNDNVIWYEPKSAPKYVNQNGIYCYFQTQNDIPNNFRFRVQYMAEDWLFFESVQFSIDGNAYKYIPLNTKTDHGNGLIWEWFDEQISSSSDRGLIEALAYSKNVKVKFNGRQYQKIKKLTKNQIIDIKNTLELYRAMGGKF